MYNTFIINIYGGPGVGKSTAAAYIFAKLKMAGIHAELVTEYAKDKIWEENYSALKCGYYINGTQAYRIARVFGKVEVIVTDSPILLGAVYANEKDSYIRTASIAEDRKYENRFDVILKRDFVYESEGRKETEDEAIAIDNEIVNILEETHTMYNEIHNNEVALNAIVEVAKEQVRKLRY
jgi:hypothetical protein